MVIVQKFGGSSLADAECLRRAVERVRRALDTGASCAVVVSAAGDTTDSLEALAHEISASPPGRELDALLATGEQQSAALMAIALDAAGIPAISFTGRQSGILTDEEHGNARIVSVKPARVLAAMGEGRVAVVSGFQGVTASGDVATLGRGGSDTTAVALAAALRAERCEIYTDVDGICTADPRLVPEARALGEIDIRDMLRLARAGSQVLHPRSVELAMEHGVEIRLLSSFRLTEGTVVRMQDDTCRPPLAGVTRRLADGTVTLVGRGTDGRVLDTLLSRLAEEGIRPLNASYGDGAVTVWVEPSELLAALRTAHSLL